MKLRNILPFLIALVLAGGAVVVGKRVLEEHNLLGSGFDPAKAHLRVVVAKDDIDPGQQIDASLLRLVEMPPGSIPEHAFNRTEDVLGRVAAVPVAKGQTIVEKTLAAKDAGQGAQALVPPGYRAVNVPADEQSGMTNLLVPGCKVDVLATLVDDATRKTIARTIVENVKVLAVGTTLSHKPSPTGVQATVAKTVTVVATPKQAEAIELAIARGRPRLVMRSGRDDVAVPTYGMTVAELVSGAVDMSAKGEAPDLNDTTHADPTTRPVYGPFLASSTSTGSLPALMSNRATLPTPEDKTPPRRTVEIIRKGVEQTKQFDLVDNSASEEPKNPSGTRVIAGGNK